MNHPPTPLVSFLPSARDRGAWLSAALLLAGLIVTLLAAHQTRSAAVADARREFIAVAKEIQLKIEDRLDDHQQVLRSGAAFLAHADGVTREEWRRFAERQQSRQTRPGMQGLGFARLVPREQLAEHVRQIRAGGQADYTVWPVGERDVYTAIVFLEPGTGRNLRAIGYDMFSEPVRRAAMERARDLDAAALSGRVVLMQETGEDVQAGALMYVPVYRFGVPHATVAERRAALVGWAYSPYRLNDLMGGVLGRWDLAKELRIRLQIFDGAIAAPEALLFDSQPGKAGQPGPVGRMTERMVVESAGHRWLLHFEQVGGLDGAVDYGKTWLVLGGGTVTSLLLAGLALSLANTRRNARTIAERLTMDLRQSEERWKYALEGPGDGVWDWNVPASTVVFSTRWKEMLGYADSEIGSGLEEWGKRVHPGDLPQVMADVRACLEGKTAAYVSEHRVRCKDGSWKWILDRGMVVRRDASGQPLRMIGTHADISTRKDAEEALQVAQLRASRFAQMLARLAEATVPRDAACIILETAGDILRWDCGFMAWWNEADGTLENILDYDLVDGVRQRLATSTLGRRQPSPMARRVITEGAQLLLRESADDGADVLQLAGTGRRSLSVLYAPVRHRGRIIGVVSIQSYEKHAYTQEALGLFQTLADQCGGVLDRIRTEDALRQSKERYDNLVARIPVGVYVIRSSPQGTLVFDYVSPKVAEMLNLSLAEILADAQRAFRQTHPDDWDGLVKLNLESFRRQRPFDWTGRILNGEKVRWLHVVSTPDPQANGDVLWHGLVVDITDRKQAEDALVASETRFREIISVSPVPMALNDDQQRITYLNAAFVQTFGYTQADIPTLADWWPKAYPDPVYRQSIADVWTAEIEKMQREGRIFSPVQLTVRCKDGTDKFVLGSATSVLKSADGIHLVVLFDITAQVAAQAALSVSLLEKEALLKEVHHRVKNNLQVISSLLRLEAGRSSHPATKGVLREMQGRIRSMALLHETLYRSGNFAAVDLADYLRQLSTQLHRSLFDRPGSIQLHVKVESVPAAIDHVIPCGLIVNELVTNCVKHGFPEGRTGEIRIELQRVAGGAEVCLRVADTGVGLPENFDPAQLRSLGLQLVSDLAGQLGGTLAIGPGPGAVFAVTFTPTQPETKQGQ